MTGQASNTSFEKCFEVTTAGYKLKAEVAIMVRIQALALLSTIAHEGSQLKSREHKFKRLTAFTCSKAGYMLLHC
jgi:homogentisate 1,2-dioxygenase